jgi:hypothetical protein
MTWRKGAALLLPLAVLLCALGFAVRQVVFLVHHDDALYRTGWWCMRPPVSSLTPS